MVYVIEFQRFRLTVNMWYIVILVAISMIYETDVLEELLAKGSCGMTENNGLAKLEAVVREQANMLHQILDVLVEMSLVLKYRNIAKAVGNDYSDENLFGEIPQRAVNVLDEAGVTTFGELIKLTPSLVKAVPGIGEVTYNKINRALEWRNLNLKDE